MAKTKITRSPAEITANWTNGMKNNITKMVNGVNSVTESPMDKAAAQKDKMLANLTKSVNDGRWEAGLKGVSLADWKQKTSTKIQSSLAVGVDNAQSKRQKFDTWLVSTLNQVLPTVNAMPKNTLDDSVAKVRALMTHMSQNRYKDQ